MLSYPLKIYMNLWTVARNFSCVFVLSYLHASGQCFMCLGVFLHVETMVQCKTLYTLFQLDAERLMFYFDKMILGNGCVGNVRRILYC